MAVNGSAVSQLHLGHNLVGIGQRTYVIAEIGSNHNGSLRQAQNLIEVAALAGADAAKFQFFDSERLYPGQTTPGAVPEEWLPALKEICVREGVDFICSIFDAETLRRYLEIEPVAIKVASPEATNTGLLEDCLDTKLPLLVSTGAMNWPQVDQLAGQLSGSASILLHCTSAYPAPPSQVNLRVITAMLADFPFPVGFSDHSLDHLATPVLAVAAGACLIEKHFTLDRALRGPDHHFALEPTQFREMVDGIRETELLLGEYVKAVQPCEDPLDRR